MLTIHVPPSYLIFHQTAAFALPMLHRLTEDPFGIFGVILTPTRELAMQIDEQFAALGARVALRHEVVIGGMDMLKQGLYLARRPHIVIATPGRLHSHLKGPRYAWMECGSQV